MTPPNLTAPRRTGQWIGLGGGVVVLGVIIALVVRWIAGIGGPGPEPPASEDPGGEATTIVCPDKPAEVPRAEHPDDDRVYGGKLSYPKLGSPWSDVRTTENRIPFGRDIAEQDITIHTNDDPYDRHWSSWVIGVFVGELYAGDGFYSPEEGSRIVNKCILGGFYDWTTVGAETLRSEAYTLDGREGWITETNLTFDIRGLPTTSELQIVIIVKTSDMSSSIFFASIPNDAVQYRPDVDRAIAGLRVVG